MLSQVHSGEGDKLYRLIASLHAASAKSRSAVVAVSRQITQLLEDNRARVLQHRFSPQEIAAARARLLDYGIHGEFRDYVGAEQAVMSVDILSFALTPTGPAVRQELDTLYGIVDDDNRYSPSKLEQQFRLFQSSVSDQ